MSKEREISLYIFLIHKSMKGDEINERRRN